jgi:hypothetical protein
MKENKNKLSYDFYILNYGKLTLHGWHNSILNILSNNPVLRGHFWDKDKVALQDRWHLKRGLSHMKLSMTGQEKSNLLIQMTA